MKTSKELLSAIERLGIHDHLCLIYETRDEQFAAVIPFVRIGLERGEKCIYIADDNTSAQVLDAMRKGGIDTEAGSGTLTVLTKREAYLKQGYFDPGWMIRFFKEAVDSAKARGYPALRISGEMTWVLGGDPGVERLFEYEAKLNYFLPKNDISALCQYNRNRIKPEIIMDVIRTHPLVIYGGLVCRNFYYVPPEEFLLPEQISHEVNRLLHNIVERERIEEVRKQAEEELYKSEKILLQMIEDSPLPMVVSEKNLKIHHVNRKFTELFGYAIDDIPTVDDWWPLAYPDPEYRRAIKERWNTAAEMAIKEKTSIEQEAMVKCKDGSLRYIIFHFSSIGERDLVIFNDITERKRAEEALKESKDELERYNIELKDALNRVKLLSGLLPICAFCKKIRDDKGNWESLEKYIEKRSEAEFSHSICPECAERLYPEYKESLD